MCYKYRYVFFIVIIFIIFKLKYEKFSNTKKVTKVHKKKVKKEKFKQKFPYKSKCFSCENNNDIIFRNKHLNKI